jgi:molecular chaperone HscB
MQNHFELFQLPMRFALDMTALQSAYRELQNRVHPDKFVQATASDQRAAMQWAMLANEAYQTLKNPMQRARYLCELNGVPLNIESHTAMPVDFLMQQMEWREALQQARLQKDGPALEQLEHDLQAQRSAHLAKIEQWFEANDFIAAAQEVRYLMFVDKFGEEVAQAFDVLDDQD